MATAKKQNTKEVAKAIVDHAKAIAGTKPAATKKTKKLPPIEDFIEKLTEDGEGEEGDGEGFGKIQMILKLHIKGYSRKEIVEAGYNKSTVYRQTTEYNKLLKAPALSHYGYELYEGRIQRLMQSKKWSRDQAVKFIAGADING